MAVQHTAVDKGHGMEYRVNPKTRLSVEKRLPSGRWETVSVHATRDDAKAALFKLVGKSMREARRD